MDVVDDENLPTDIRFLSCNSQEELYPKNEEHRSFRRTLRHLMSNSASSDRSFSSSSRAQVDARMRNELRYFFMNPCQKYKLRKRKPFKLAVQIFKIALVTLQLIIFGQKNQAMVSFLDGTYEVFRVNLLSNQTEFFVKNHVYLEINSILKQYEKLGSSSIGNYGYWKVNDFSCNEGDTKYEDKLGNHQPPPPVMCVKEYVNFKADWINGTPNYDTSGQHRICHCLKPWSKLKNTSLANSTIVLLNGSSYDIKFNRLIELDLYMGLHAMRLKSIHSYHQTDCYNTTLTVKFDNSEHCGKINLRLDADFLLADCPHFENKLSTKPIVVLLLLLDFVIIATCSVSMLLCVRSLWRAKRLRKSFEKFYWKRFKKKLEFSVKLEFFNGWYLLIIISDILTIMGSIAKVVIEVQWQGYINYDWCSVCLGVGCLCVWVGVLRYAGFFHQYNILVLTLKHSLPHVLRFMVCACIMYLGFMFCGWVVLGPYHHKFRNPIVTSEALFSLVNGDDMYMTFEEMSKKSFLTWFFSQIYLYAFISLFIYIVLSLFIAVIMETYETIKEWQLQRFPPQNEIQKFLSEHTNEEEDREHDYNADTYCCCCLYHNNRPDISVDDSSDEEILVT